MTTSIELRQERARTVQSMRAITETAEAANRSLEAAERTQYDAHEAEFRSLTERIERQEADERRNAEAGVSLAGGAAASSTGQVRRLTAGQPMAAIFQRSNSSAGPLSFDRVVRGMASGDWRRAESELRAISGLSDPSGGVMLSEEVSSRVIDLARAASITTQAGAQTVVMETRKLSIPRLLTDMTPQWLAELETATASNPTFDSLDLEAKTVRVYAEISQELIEDAETSENFIEQIAARAIAREVDRVALAGSGEQEPRGLINQPGITVANPQPGVTKWVDLARAQAAVRGRGYEPGAVILHPQAEVDLTTTPDTVGQFVRPPASLESIRRISSNAVPANLGTGGSKALLGIGAWSSLVIGWRTQITIKTQPMLDKNGVQLSVTARLDVGIERAGAFDLRLVNLGS